jgi:hypothetical protein
MNRLILSSLSLVAMTSASFAAIPVIDSANLAQAAQITENTQQIMESDAKIMEHTQKTLAAVTGDRTSDSGEMANLALGDFKMGAAPDLGSVISGGVLSFAGMGQGSQENVAKLINAMQLVKSISGLAGEDMKEFDKVYESFVNVTATVMGLVDSTQGAVTSRSDSYTSAAQKIGSAPDLKGSIDQNSQIQAQNGMTVNELIGTMNTATTAINQQNLDAIARQSALTKVTEKAQWNLPQ